MNMVEKVARAIFASQEWSEFSPAFEHQADEVWLQAARAAIEAMRDPSLEMRQAGAFKGRLIDLGNGMTADGFALGDHPITSYGKMIDAALAEERR